MFFFKTSQTYPPIHNTPKAYVAPLHKKIKTTSQTHTFAYMYACCYNIQAGNQNMSLANTLLLYVYMRICSLYLFLSLSTSFFFIFNLHDKLIISIDSFMFQYFAGRGLLSLSSYCSEQRGYVVVLFIYIEKNISLFNREKIAIFFIFN